jgi:hypothetical protein
MSQPADDPGFKWVEWMRDPHKLPRRIRRVCILS